MDTLVKVLLLELLLAVVDCDKLTAIKATLAYYRQLSPNLSSSTLFGAALLEGQLYSLHFDDEETQAKVHQIIKLCDEIIEENPKPWLNLHMVKRLARHMGSLKERGMQSVGRARPLDYRLEDRLVSGRPSPFQSTYCIIEAMSTSPMSSSCLSQETDPHAAGYTLTHQAIYIMINAAMRKNTRLTESILSKLCNKILSETNYTWEKGMPLELTDLFIEQVAVCGIPNYKEFLNESFADFIMSLQQEEGCFSTSTLASSDKCDDHLSAVSMVALANFLHHENESS